VLLTTHYMDEAERCHRLAFIFRGRVLDVGTPPQIVERRNLRAAELETDRPREAGEALRRELAVDEVSHYGDVLRLTTRAGSDPAALAQRVLAASGIAIQRISASRVTVEDAFVSMVRDDDKKHAEAAA
jgi:ABC-2 type transport system ATP-binding protein